MGTGARRSSARIARARVRSARAPGNHHVPDHRPRAGSGHYGDGQSRRCRPPRLLPLRSLRAGRDGRDDVQENWYPNIGKDILTCLDRVAPQGQWLHDRVDDNGAAHIKAGIVGRSETIPARDGKLLLSRWQNIVFCEFDGPRREREVVVTLL